MESLRKRCGPPLTTAVRLEWDQPGGVLFDWEYEANIYTGIRPYRCADKWIVPCILGVRCADRTRPEWHDPALVVTDGGYYYALHALSDEYGPMPQSLVANGKLMSGDAVTLRRYDASAASHGNRPATVWFSSTSEEWPKAVADPAVGTATFPNLETQWSWVDSDLFVVCGAPVYFFVQYEQISQDDASGFSRPNGPIILSITYCHIEMDPLEFEIFRKRHMR